MAPYEIVGVRPEASQIEIVAAYRRFWAEVGQYETAEVAKIQEAYRILLNPATRARYDQARREAQPTSRPATTPTVTPTAPAPAPTHSEETFIEQDVLDTLTHIAERFYVRKQAAEACAIGFLWAFGWGILAFGLYNFYGVDGPYYLCLGPASYGFCYMLNALRYYIQPGLMINKLNRQVEHTAS
jgi:hypothetical protein